MIANRLLFLFHNNNLLSFLAHLFIGFLVSTNIKKIFSLKHHITHDHQLLFYLNILLYYFTIIHFYSTKPYLKYLFAIDFLISLLIMVFFALRHFSPKMYISNLFYLPFSLNLNMKF